jgi:phosphoribosylaminoimidazole-succinocarboxamide synthase
MPSVTDLKLLSSGKVREAYEWDDDLLMVASDRISTYDVVMPTPIPDKGKVLNRMSVFWFGLTEDIVPNHFISEDVPEEVAERARGRRLQRKVWWSGDQLGSGGSPAIPPSISRISVTVSNCRDG